MCLCSRFSRWNAWLYVIHRCCDISGQFSLCGMDMTLHPLLYAYERAVGVKHFSPRAIVPLIFSYNICFYTPLHRQCYEATAFFCTLECSVHYIIEYLFDIITKITWPVYILIEADWGTVGKCGGTSLSLYSCCSMSFLCCWSKVVDLCLYYVNNLNCLLKPAISLQ